ncbi:MAG TPA: DUF421 domain-containing protein [Syntrophomonadaceae bacterium]|nr:DUF421 domain-containing protein [Syntrophomonadaceae bacterium]HOQ09309.1 DUF421 domain-containing protein [Syntrophomonadaceae bacterium]HPU48899.1 DUF421 domain-containing protein [Syntrophomonadaceae bacterium]
MLDFVLRAVVMYVMALVMIRLLGKRALGELGPFDFVVMTGVGHTVVSVALDRSIPYYEGIIILATLAGLEYIMGILALKSQTLSNLIVGRPVVLIDNGRIIRENLAREKCNVDDLMQELRKQGIRDIDEVEKGILESCGGFSVIRKEGDEPVTRRDLGLKETRGTQIRTFDLAERKDIFAQQEQESWQDEPELNLPEVLREIADKLQAIDKRLQSLENPRQKEGG